jgi:hypothetical protein
MNENKTVVRPLVRELAREMTQEDLMSIAGGVKCAPTGGASGTANWDVGVDDGIGF